MTRRPLILPSELLVAILAQLRLQDLLRCKQVCKRFALLVRDSAVLRYKIELGHAAMKETLPDSQKLTTMKRLEHLRKQQFGWRNLAWTKRQGVSVSRTSNPQFEIDSGVFVTHKYQGIPQPIAATNSKLIFQELPCSAITKPLSYVELDCPVETTHTTFDMNQDLLVLLEKRVVGPNASKPPPFRIHLRSLATNLAHYSAKEAVLEYDCNSCWNSYKITMQIMGRHLGVLFSSGVLGDSDYERFVVWDWTTGVIRGLVFMANSRYDSFSFLTEDTFVLPCARTESINVFIFRPTPPPGFYDRGPAIKHLCALQLPQLQLGVHYTSVLCRSQPTPDSLLAPTLAQGVERPPKYFTPITEDGIVVFSANISGKGKNKDISIVTHRQALLDFITPNPDILGDPLPDPWESYPMMPSTEWWGPPVPFPVWRAIARAMVDRRPSKYLESVYGYRMAQMVYDKNPFSGNIQVMDFNPLFIKRPPIFPEDNHPLIQKSVRRRINADVSIIPHEGLFTEDLVSSLPYYEVTSVASFNLSGLLLDDERIIGLKTGGPGQPDIVSLEVFVM